MAAVRLGLTLLSYRRVRRWLPRGRSASAHPAMCWRTARAVTRAAALVPGASCLTQAIAVQLILAWRGYASEIQVGVGTSETGGLNAHAWLLSEGRVVIGGSAAELAAYAPLTKLVPS